MSPLDSISLQFPNGPYRPNYDNLRESFKYKHFIAIVCLIMNNNKMLGEGEKRRVIYGRVRRESVFFTDFGEKLINTN